MPATTQKIIQDQVTQLMLQQAIALAYQQGLYPDTTDFQSPRSRAQIAQDKIELLTNAIAHQFDAAFKSDIVKKLNALLNNIKKLKKDELAQYIKSLNNTLATGGLAQDAVDIFTDVELQTIQQPEPPAKQPSKQSPEKAKYSPKHLVLSGGGIKGVANETIFETLQNNGVLEGIDYCYGSSVGGLSAALLALGYNIDEAKENMQVTKKMLLDPYRHEEVAPLASAKFMIKNFFKHAAIAKGYKLYELSQSVVAQKLGDPNATFADLERRFGQETPGGGKFRHLSVTATVKDPRLGFYQVVLNAQTAPNMPIALALRMTAGLPPAFRGVELTPEELANFRIGATQPLVQYNRGKGFPPYDPTNPHDEIPVTVKKRNTIKFIDGGVTDNLPIYLPVQHGAKMDEIIALNFVEPWREEHREMNKDKFTANKIIRTMDEKDWINSKQLRENDFLYYVYQRKRYLHKPALPPGHLVKAEQANAVINIPTGDVQAAEFDLSEKRKESLRQVGKKVAENHLRMHGIEPKIIKPNVQQKQVLDLHDKHKAILQNAKEFLGENFGLNDNADYENFKKHVDKAGKEISVVNGVITQRVKIANVKFYEIYKMRNAVSDAFEHAKQESNLAQRCLYSMWKRVPVIKKIVKKVDENLNSRFEEYYEFVGVIKALNGALKAQRVAGMEVGHKKQSPYKDHLGKPLKNIKQPKQITTRIMKKRK
ncbi:MAG: patatin-like phospholipase family protein [Candidatus Berkiella sp.]